MKKTTNTLLWVIDVISTLIFCAMCTTSAYLLILFFYHLFDSEGAKDWMMGKDISQLFNLNNVHFGILFSLTLAISLMKALAFYFTIKIFSTLNLVKPFSPEIATLISRISYMILAVGTLGIIAFRFSEIPAMKGMELSALQGLWHDNYVYLLMGSIIFVIAQVFKKGLELQAENDLTI
ncbi:DUF2975 domain-containing protein [Algoriphagus sp. AK58]|uniref:DUF2975 domain-containing protein n=1 Tax=Algoriphagus sp. AK58 TaxID=1406877 RepID=UPI00164F8BD7|nr:DUF2975 domain-containing protein [Algoriphagus sp. AK58]MBC6368321.1 hypothetical protein [Algoriphagus sp. AK58]